jgi:hypothetical protein
MNQPTPIFLSSLQVPKSQLVRVDTFDPPRRSARKVRRKKYRIGVGVPLEETPARRASL